MEGRLCPEVVNRPRHPAEREAWAIAGSRGAWRALEHPRWKDRPPALDWPAARQLHNPVFAPWDQVRPLLLALEAAAGEGAKERQTDEDPQ